MIDPKELRVESIPEPPKRGMILGRPPTGVRVTHLPSGVSVESNKHRHMHKNKADALELIETILNARG